MALGLKGPGFYGQDFVVIKEGMDRLAESIKRILMTLPGERVNNPLFGSRLKYYLFSSSTDIIRLKGVLKEDLEKWEPTITVDEVNIDLTNQDQHIAKLSINFTIKETGERVTYNLNT